MHLLRARPLLQIQIDPVDPVIVLPASHLKGESITERDCHRSVFLMILIARRKKSRKELVNTWLDILKKQRKEKEKYIF
jgi:hypothetical protein